MPMLPRAIQFLSLSSFWLLSGCVTCSVWHSRNTTVEVPATVLSIARAPASDPTTGHIRLLIEYRIDASSGSPPVEPERVPTAGVAEMSVAPLSWERFLLAVRHQAPRIGEQPRTTIPVHLTYRFDGHPDSANVWYGPSANDPGRPPPPGPYTLKLKVHQCRILPPLVPGEAVRIEWPDGVPCRMTILEEQPTWTLPCAVRILATPATVAADAATLPLQFLSALVWCLDQQDRSWVGPFMRL